MEEENIKIKTIILEKAYHKIKSFCKIANTNEWLGLLITDFGHKTIYVKDIIFPHQTVSGGNVELNVDEFSKEMGKLMKGNELKNIRGVIHSHNNMSTFWSGVDDIMNSNVLGSQPHNSVFVSIVVNNEMSFKTKALIRFSDFSFTIDDIPTTTELKEKNNVLKECQKLWDKKVKIDRYDYGGYSGGLEKPTYTILDKKTRKWIAKMYNKIHNAREALKLVKTRKGLSKLEKKDLRKVMEAYFGMSSFAEFELLELRKVSKKEYEALEKYRKEEKKKIKSQRKFPQSKFNHYGYWGYYG